MTQTALDNLKAEVTRILEAFGHDAEEGVKKAEHALFELFDAHPLTSPPPATEQAAEAPAEEKADEQTTEG